MAVDKHVFFKDVAKRLAASTLLYKVDSVVHVEDKDDIWFWEQLLLKYRPGRYKFKPATMNEKGNRTAGCAQCLKYKGFLSQKFLFVLTVTCAVWLERIYRLSMEFCRSIPIHGRIIVLLPPNYSVLLLIINKTDLTSPYFWNNILLSCMNLFY